MFPLPNPSQGKVIIETEQQSFSFLLALKPWDHAEAKECSRTTQGELPRRGFPHTCPAYSLTFWFYKHPHNPIPHTKKTQAFAGGSLLLRLSILHTAVEVLISISVL